MAETVFVSIPRETVNDESVRILSWKVPSGSIVGQGQLLCEVETSKVVMEIEAPVAGLVTYGAAPGDEVNVGATICQVTPHRAEQPSVAAPEGADLPNIAQMRAPLNGTAAADAGNATVDLPPARLTPLAAKMAAEFGFSKESFARGSMVRRDDVLRRAGKLPVEPAAAAYFAPPADNAAGRERNGAVAGVVVEWTELPRRKVFEARMLGQGKAQIIQSQVTSSLRAPQLRWRLDRLWPAGVGLGALVTFEAARLLRKYPEFNAVHDHGMIGKYSDVNIGWAIDAGQGLMVPVVREADRKTVHEIAEIMVRQMEGYVGGTLSPADLLAGTFTISDLSGDCISHFSPLITQGQAAILGVGAERDAAANETLYLTLAFDHQLAEGRKAAHFVRDLAGRLEAHGAVENEAPQRSGSGHDAPLCALCLRDAETLRAMKAMLVRSEIPSGFVCSVCLAGLS